MPPDLHIVRVIQGIWSWFKHSGQWLSPSSLFMGTYSMFTRSSSWQQNFKVRHRRNRGEGPTAPSHVALRILCTSPQKLMHEHRPLSSKIFVNVQRHAALPTTQKLPYSGLEGSMNPVLNRLVDCLEKFFSALTLHYSADHGNKRLQFPLFSMVTTDIIRSEHVVLDSRKHRPLPL